jgi:hypothetical protein
MAKGQKSLTLTEMLHEKLTKCWEKNQEKLKRKYNVESFTAYAQQLIEKGVEEDLLEPRFEIVNRFENEIRVRDYFLAKDAVIRLNVEGPYAVVFCELDKTGKCPHVGFVLSDPKVLKDAKEHGVALRKSPKSVTVEEAKAIFERATGKKDEISDKEFVEKVTSDTGYDKSQAIGMLRTLYTDYWIAISKEQAGIYYFKRV